MSNARRILKGTITIVEHEAGFAAVSRAEPVFFLEASSRDAALERAQVALQDYISTFHSENATIQLKPQARGPEPVVMRELESFDLQLAYA